jgi:hypothetical protein
MREIRLSGSEGGGKSRLSPYPYRGHSRFRALRRSYLQPFRNLNMEIVLPRSAKETSVM